MKFKNRNLRAIADAIIGDNDKFHYRSSSYITRFFEECDLDFVHDGSTRWSWTVDRISELLDEPQFAPNTLPERFVHVLRVLMHKADAADDDPDRSVALGELNKPLAREGFEAFYGEDDLLYIRHIGTQTISIATNPHRPFTTDEIKKRERLVEFLDQCSEDELIEEVLLPLFRQMGFHRITAAGHKDKSLEYGKDIWMRYVLPTQHVLYFGIQVKKGKLDSAGATKSSNANVAEIHNQALMMLGHEIFDPETSKKVLVDHAFIVAGGEITKQAKNWLGGKLDASKRSQIMFMDREDILNLYIVNNIPLPERALPDSPTNFCHSGDDIPF
ncbi:MAG: restriction endonuclease [Candidatus Thiodiazotropha taylori]|nr:restriction endonuclease [Candidatus Thiodiazotropha endolucinida]MCW4227672.1 restriction endonuclease [Candidatus Thiodiazotropha taylori]